MHWQTCLAELQQDRALRLRAKVESLEETTARRREVRRLRAEGRVTEAKAAAKELRKVNGKRAATFFYFVAHMQERLGLWGSHWVDLRALGSRLLCRDLCPCVWISAVVLGSLPLCRDLCPFVGISAPVSRSLPLC